MLGAIIGDIVGSRFEFDNVKSTNFKLFTSECSFTGRHHLHGSCSGCHLERQRAIRTAYMSGAGSIHTRWEAMEARLPLGYVRTIRNRITALATGQQCV